jgi:hypothetical protein
MKTLVLLQFWRTDHLPAGYRFIMNSRESMLFTCRWMPNKMDPKVLIFIFHGTNESSLLPFFHISFDCALGKLNNVTFNISQFASIWGRVQWLNHSYKNCQVPNCHQQRFWCITADNHILSASVLEPLLISEYQQLF